jgi:hypothetical protein
VTNQTNRCYRPNVAFTGPDLETFSAGTKDNATCGDACVANGKCVASSYDRVTTECAHKAKIGDMVYDSDKDTTMRNCRECSKRNMIIWGVHKVLKPFFLISLLSLGAHKTYSHKLQNLSFNLAVLFFMCSLRL